MPMNKHLENLEEIDNFPGKFDFPAKFFKNVFKDITSLEEITKTKTKPKELSLSHENTSHHKGNLPAFKGANINQF